MIYSNAKFGGLVGKNAAVRSSPPIASHKLMDGRWRRLDGEPHRTNNILLLCFPLLIVCLIIHSYLHDDLLR
jgi:hypothetical protein